MADEAIWPPVNPDPGQAPAPVPWTPGDGAKKGWLSRSVQKAGDAKAERKDRTGKRLAVFEGIALYERWIEQGKHAGSLQGVHADVDTAGGFDRRLSATRVLMTGGVGLFWKKKLDNRELYLSIEGPGLSIVKELQPDLGKKAREFASKVNAAASRMPAADQPTDASTAMASVADELRKLADLRDQGLLSAAEFDGAKAKLLA